MAAQLVQIRDGSAVLRGQRVQLDLELDTSTAGAEPPVPSTSDVYKAAVHRNSPKVDAWSEPLFRKHIASKINQIQRDLGLGHIVNGRMLFGMRGRWSQAAADILLSWLLAPTHPRGPAQPKALPAAPSAPLALPASGDVKDSENDEDSSSDDSSSSSDSSDKSEKKETESENHIQDDDDDGNDGSHKESAPKENVPELDTLKRRITELEEELFATEEWARQEEAHGERLEEDNARLERENKRLRLQLEQFNTESSD